MQYYLVKGNLLNPNKINDNLFEEHKKYTSNLMNENKILLSSLDSKMTFSLTIIKVKDYNEVINIYHNEPFYLNNIIDYDIKKLDIHYLNEDISNWIK